METRVLASYAAGLRYDDLPEEVIRRSTDTILDSLAAAVYGVDLPWSRILVGYARRYGQGGRSSILGVPDGKVQAPMGALVNGALVHSFELDNVRHPGAGVHAGATLVPAGLAVAEEMGASGRELLAAFVAGCEVMFRVGRACREIPEKLGFHAPALTGAIGAAATAGRLLRLGDDQMACAFGIAGSLASGLLEFAKSGSGGMVKRLHLGRAAEGGVLAASLARDGFTGPETVLEGKFGFLRAFAREPDLTQLTRGLGTDYEVMTVCMKRFPFHINAQAPIQALLELRAEHPFAGEEVEAITIACNEKTLSHHNLPEPKDVMAAQYSVPFSAALSLFRNPLDPRAVSEESLGDPKIRSLSQRTTLVLNEAARDVPGYRGARVTVRLGGGRELGREVWEFKGTPAHPLSREELHEKFAVLTSGMGEEASRRLLRRIDALEAEEDVSRLLA